MFVMKNVKLATITSSSWCNGFDWIVFNFHNLQFCNIFFRKESLGWCCWTFQGVHTGISWRIPQCKFAASLPCNLFQFKCMISSLHLACRMWACSGGKCTVKGQTEIWVVYHLQVHRQCIQFTDYIWELQLWNYGIMVSPAEGGLKLS